MREKRKYERLPVSINLSISDLFHQDNSGLHGLEAPIEVTDISERGVCFISECILPENYYFNARLAFGADHAAELFSVVRIIRSEAIDSEHFRYGCEFEGLPRDISDILNEYGETE